MIVFTNRTVNGSANESAFDTAFIPGGTRLSLASVGPAASGTWALSDVDADVDDNDSLKALVPLFQGSRPILVYIHGNNNTPANCFERCTLLASLYKVEVVGFSWPSEGYLSDGTVLPGVSKSKDGDEADLEEVNSKNRTKSGIQNKIRRYRQAKINAQDSVDALARFLRMVATARLYVNKQPFSVAIHSLGSHFVQNTLEIPGASESLSTAQNVAFVAACSRASGHKTWLVKVRPKGQVFVAYNKADSVLFGAAVADNGQTKLGLDPTIDRLALGSVRYASFSNAQTGFGGHRYFARKNMPKKQLELFRRMFNGEVDIQNNDPTPVYPHGCDADGLTCYVGATDSGPEGPP